MCLLTRRISEEPQYRTMEEYIGHVQNARIYTNPALFVIFLVYEISIHHFTCKNWKLGFTGEKNPYFINLTPKI